MYLLQMLFYGFTRIVSSKIKKKVHGTNRKGDDVEIKDDVTYVLLLILVDHIKMSSSTIRIDISFKLL